MTDTGECALHRAWNPRGKKVNSGAGRNRDDEEFARRIPSPLLRLLSLFSSFLSLFPFPFVACQRTNRREQDGRRYFRFAIFTRGRGCNGAKNHLSRRKVGERILREFFHGSRPTDLALIFRPFRSFPWPRPRLPPPRPPPSSTAAPDFYDSARGKIAFFHTSCNAEPARRRAPITSA